MGDEECRCRLQAVRAGVQARPGQAMEVIRTSTSYTLPEPYLCMYLDPTYLQ